MQPPAWWTRRRKRRSPPDLSLGMALVHLGVAIKAHQEGNLLLAVRHLAMASETISGLIEQWTGAQDENGEEVEGVPL